MDPFLFHSILLTYPPVLVFTSTISPSLMNRGTLIVDPVSKVTCLVPASARPALIPGGASTTFKRILTRWGFDELVLQTKPENLNKAKEEVAMIMRVARKLKPDQDDNFSVNSVIS